MVGWLQKIIDEQKEHGLSMEKANEVMQEIDREHMEAGLCIAQVVPKAAEEEEIKLNIKKYDVALYGATMEDDYGTLMTYYALYKTVERMGYSIGLIPPPLPKEEAEQKNLAARFCENYMHICEQLPKSEMKNYYDIADTFLLGSDEVWNYIRFPERQETVYLNFLKNKKKKIAYGASFGSKKPTIFPDYPEKYPRIMQAMQRFDAISVSEASGVDVCEKYYGTAASQVLDPVFLLKVKDYQELAEKAENIPSDKYMCVYASSGDKLQDVAKEVSEALKLPSVNLGAGNLSVEDWLGHMMHSEFVVTDSYYGVCFAIIFKKKFIVVQDSCEVTRMEALLDALGLKKRWFRTVAEFGKQKKILEQEIDYDKVCKRLNQGIYQSQNWLRKAISGKKKVYCRDTMPEAKSKDEAYEQIYGTENASEYYAVLDSLKEELIVMIAKKGKKDSAIVKVKFFEDGGIGPKTKEKAKSNGLSYIYDFENETTLKKLEEFGHLTYYFNETKFVCYSEGKTYEKNKKKIAEFIVEQSDKKDIYRTSEDGLYTLVYSKKENRVIDFVYLDVSKESELLVEHLLN